MRSILLLLFSCVTLVSTVFGSHSRSIEMHSGGPDMRRSDLLYIRDELVSRMVRKKLSDPEYLQKVKLYWQNYEDDDFAKERILQQISRGDYRLAIKSFLIYEGHKEDSQLLKLKQVTRVMPADR